MKLISWLVRLSNCHFQFFLVFFADFDCVNWGRSQRVDGTWEGDQSLALWTKINSSVRYTLGLAWVILALLFWRLFRLYCAVLIWEILFYRNPLFLDQRHPSRGQVGALLFSGRERFLHLILEWVDNKLVAARMCIFSCSLNIFGINTTGCPKSLQDGLILWHFKGNSGHPLHCKL